MQLYLKTDQKKNHSIDREFEGKKRRRAYTDIFWYLAYDNSKFYWNFSLYIFSKI